MTPPTKGIHPLDDLGDYTVAQGDADPRGWDVISSDNKKIGEVKDLLVDLQAMTVRYLDVELDHNAAGKRERHVLFPLGMAHLDGEQDLVLVGIAAARARDLPIYRKVGAVPREYEDSVLDMMGIGASRAAGPTIDYYARPEFDTAGFYGTRSTRNVHPDERELPVAERGRRAGDVELRNAVDDDTSLRRAADHDSGGNRPGFRNRSADSTDDVNRSSGNV